MRDDVPKPTNSTRELSVRAIDLRFGLGQRVCANRTEATPQLVEISRKHATLNVDTRTRRSPLSTAIRRRAVVERTLLELQESETAARSILTPAVGTLLRLVLRTTPHNPHLDLACFAQDGHCAQYSSAAAPMPTPTPQRPDAPT